LVAEKFEKMSQMNY